MNDILGFYPLAFYGIALLVILVAYIILRLFLNQRQRRKHEEEARGKLLCEFCSPEGAFTELCDVWKGMVKKAESQRGTFLSNRWINPPKGYEEFADIYLVLQDHCYPVRWPEGKPWGQQITVMKTHFLIGDPVPKIAYDPSKWDIEKYTRTTTAIMKYAFDERTMQVITSAIGDIEKRIQNLVRYLKSIPILQVSMIILALLTIMNIVVTCQNKSAIAGIANFMHIP